MKRFEHIIIASDLDGTFFGEENTLVVRNLDAIRYFKEEGGHFTFATGRTADIILPKIPMAAELLNLPAVTGNGTCLYDVEQKRAEEEYFLSYDIISDLGKFFEEEAPDFSMRSSSNIGMVGYDPSHPYIREESEKYRDQYSFIPLSEWNRFGTYKLAVRAIPERMKEMYPVFVKRFGHRAQLALSWDSLLDVQKLGRTKAIMLREMVAKRFDEPTVLCAVGDYENDLEMLSIADLAACPDNAIDAVKAICPLHLCSHNEGAIADLIEYLDTHDVSHLATKKA